MGRRTTATRMKTRSRAAAADCRRDHASRRAGSGKPAGRRRRKTPPEPPSAAMTATTTKTACCACPSSSTWRNCAAAFIKALMGVGVAFLASIWFSDELWKVVRQPAAAALKSLGYQAGPGADHPHGDVQHHLGEAADSGRDFSRFALDSVPGLGIHRAGSVPPGTTPGRAVRHLSPRGCSSPAGYSPISSRSASA